MTEDGFIIVPHLNPGGTSRDAVEWANRFQAKGLRVPVLALRDGGTFRLRLRESVPFELLNLAGTFVGLPRLLRRLRASPRAFVLTNCASSACAVILYKWLGLFEGRLVFVESVNPAQALRSSRKAAFAYYLIHGHADAIVHISQFGYDYARRLRLPACRSHYIPNIVPAGSSRIKPVKQAALRLLAVGRLDVVKGYDRLINAMPAVHRTFPGATLRICGEGDQNQQLQALITRLGLESQVELLGHVDEVAKELRQADVFLQTSHFEGMPNALIEALAAGLPVVGTSCGGSVRRLLLQLGAEKSLVADGSDFERSLLGAIGSACDGSINWAEVDVRFKALYDESHNFTSLSKLCQAGGQIKA